MKAHVLKDGPQSQTRVQSVTNLWTSNNLGKTQETIAKVLRQTMVGTSPQSTIQRQIISWSISRELFARTALGSEQSNIRLI